MKPRFIGSGTVPHTVFESPKQQSAGAFGAAKCRSTVKFCPMIGGVLLLSSGKQGASCELQRIRMNNNPAVQLEWRLTTDGGLQLGGWTIDDVELFSFQALPRPTVEFIVNPAHVPLSTVSNVTVAGTPNAPIGILLSTNPGPTKLPGVPPLAVGSDFVALGARLDGSGNLAFSFTATSAPSSVGTLIYSQVVELTNATTLTTSNPMVILIAR